MQSGSCKMAALGAQKVCAPRAATGAASGAAARNPGGGEDRVHASTPGRRRSYLVR